MNFKTKKEFENSIIWSEYGTNDHSTGYDEAISDVFKSFTERVAFYKKYRSHGEVYDGWNRFKKHFPKEYESFPKYCKKQNVRVGTEVGEVLWNAWLFDFCFGDIK